MNIATMTTNCRFEKAFIGTIRTVECPLCYMNSLYVSHQPFLADSSVVTKSELTLDGPVLLLQTVSVMMVMDLILFTGLTPDMKDPGTLATPAFLFLVRDHCREIEMFEATDRAGISDDLQVNMLDMVLHGFL